MQKENSSSTTKKVKRSHNREQPLMDAAAKLFASKGYKETTMRDISSEIGMLPGSVYYHFKSKQKILLAVYKQAVDGLKTRVENSISNQSDPWIRLEIATVTHLEAIIDQNDYAQVMTEVLPDKAPEIHRELTAMRDSYENIFAEIINTLPLKADVNKGLLRLMLIGALNSTKTWFQTGNIQAEEIGREYIRYLKDSIKE